jgi:small subunit ribosomal protein S6
MRNYEIILIVHPDLDDEAFKETVEKVKGWISDSGGEITKEDHWGKRRMAYAIRKQREGQYMLLNVQLDPAFTKELDHNMRFLEPVLRFLITTIEE